MHLLHLNEVLEQEKYGMKNLSSSSLGRRRLIGKERERTLEVMASSIPGFRLCRSMHLLEVIKRCASDLCISLSVNLT